MTRITAYILKQIAVSTMLVVITLTAAIWLTQSLRFIDWIVNRGLPLSTFAYIAVLVLPSFLVVILPIALFAAVLFTYNKLQGDSEIIVLRAVGVGPFQLITPAVMVAVVIVSMGYALNLYLLPASYRAFKDLQFQIRNNYSAVLLQEGVFTSLDQGLTLFVREQGANGDLNGIMVHDSRDPLRPITMVAERGALVNSGEGPRIIMVNGNRQELSRRDGRVSFLFFERYTVDIDRMNAAVAGNRQRESTERFLDELLDPDDIADPRVRAALRADGHQRLAAPLYAFAFVMVAMAALLSGNFSRRGQASRVLMAVAGVIGVQALGIGLANLSSRIPQLIPLMYLNAVLPIGLSFYLLSVQPTARGAAAPAGGT